jgi:hypothetical protein
VRDDEAAIGSAAQVKLDTGHARIGSGAAEGGKRILLAAGRPSAVCDHLQGASPPGHPQNATPARRRKLRSCRPAEKLARITAGLAALVRSWAIERAPPGT